MACSLADRRRIFGELCWLHHLLTWRLRKDSSAKHLYVPIKLQGSTSRKTTNERLNTVNTSTPVRWKFFCLFLLNKAVILILLTVLKYCKSNMNLFLLLRTSTNIIVCVIESYANLCGSVLRLLSPSSAKVERWLYGAVPQLPFVLMAWSLIKYRDNYPVFGLWSSVLWNYWTVVGGHRPHPTFTYSTHKLVAVSSFWNFVATHKTTCSSLPVVHINCCLDLEVNCSWMKSVMLWY